MDVGNSLMRIPDGTVFIGILISSVNVWYLLVMVRSYLERLDFTSVRFGLNEEMKLGC